MSHDDELRSRLRRLAESHEPVVVGIDAVEARRDRRSTRRRFTVVAAALLLVLGIAGFFRVIEGDGSGDVDVASSDDDTPSGTDDGGTDDGADGGGVEEEDVEGGVAQSSVPAVTTTYAPGAAADSSFAGPGYGGPDWIVPWGDGFLSLGRIFVPSDVTMQDLVPDIEERFSPEIIELLQEAGVTGIDESIEVLSEAGLLDEATEAVTSDPVLLAAYNEVTQGGQYRFEASVSPDGRNWTVLSDFGPPGGSQTFSSVQSDGEHLVVAEQVWDSTAERTARILVSSTTDLVNWTTTSLPFERPDTPDYVTADVGLNGVTIGPDGWYAMTSTSMWLDIWRLLPDDLRRELETEGYGWSAVPEGLRIESYSYDDGYSEDALEGAVEIRTVPWSDLGITYDDYIRYVEGGDGQVAQAWVGGWDGQVAPATPAVATNCCQVIGTDTGFIAQSWGGYEDGPVEPSGPELHYSPDGQTWTPVDDLPGDGWLGGIVSLDGGVLVTVAGDDGTPQIWRGGPSGTDWRVVEIPGLPATSNLWFDQSGGGGVVTVVDVATYDYSYEAVEFEVTFEWDGVEIFTHSYPDRSIDLRVTDLSTEEVIVERLGVTTDGVVPEFVDIRDDGIAILDDDGNEIVAVPMDAYFAAMSEAEQTARVESGWVEPDYQYTPDFWLVATADGVSWHVEDLPDTDEGFYYGQGAVNGSIAVVRAEQGWVTFDIG